MPDGRNFSIRALIFSETRTGLAQIRNGGSGQSATPDGALVNLERVELDRLLIILGFVFPGEITTVSSDAAEGVPVSLSIYRRIPLAHRAADCNLAGWLNSRKSAPPVIEIGCLLMNLRARAGQG